jgi:hypothetical protein
MKKPQENLMTENIDSKEPHIFKENFCGKFNTAPYQAKIFIFPQILMKWKINFSSVESNLIFPFSEII